jgi:hypothetical protein
MPEIVAASVMLGVPILGELQASHFVAGCGEEHVGAAALLVRTAADFAQAEHLQEGNAVFQTTTMQWALRPVRKLNSAIRRALQCNSLCERFSLLNGGALIWLLPDPVR